MPSKNIDIIFIFNSNFSNKMKIYLNNLNSFFFRKYQIFSFFIYCYLLLSIFLLALFYHLILQLYNSLFNIILYILLLVVFKVKMIYRYKIF